MDKENLIQEFETNVIEITNKCLLKLDNSTANKNVEICNEFQKYIAEEARKVIHKAIENNVDERINIAEKITELSIQYAEKLRVGLKTMRTDCQ